MVAGILFCTLSFILLFLEPFKTGESPKLIVLGYSFYILLAFILILLLESLIFKVRSNWTLGYEVLMQLLFFITVAVAVYWYDLTVVKSKEYVWDGLMLFTIRITIPFTIVLLPLIIWLRIRFGEKIELPDQYQVVIKGSVKSDVLAIDQRLIYYVQSSNNYVVVKHLKEDGLKGESLIRCTLSQAKTQLPHFTQCHRSFIVNPDKIEAIEGTVKKAFLKVSDLNDQLPVSKSYYQKVKEVISKGM